MTEKSAVMRLMKTMRMSRHLKQMPVLNSLPTAYWVNLRLPRLRPVVEFITLLPLVIPAIVIVFGYLRLYNSSSWLPLTASARATDLLQAWQSARQHDPDMAVAQSALQAGQARRDQASALWRPTVAATAAGGAMGSRTSTAGASNAVARSTPPPVSSITPARKSSSRNSAAR